MFSKSRRYDIIENCRRLFIKKGFILCPSFPLLSRRSPEEAVHRGLFPNLRYLGQGRSSGSTFICSLVNGFSISGIQLNWFASADFSQPLVMDNNRYAILEIFL